MSQDWADFERESIKRIGQPGQPTAFQEYGIQFLTGLMQGSPAQGKIDTDELAHQILQSGQSLADTWWDFLNLFFSAASSTSNDSSHERLVSLVFALANHVSRKTTADPSKDREVDSLFKNLTQFGMVAREHWNGPSWFESTRGPGKAAQEAWVNLNRFVAHLSRQYRRTPIQPLDAWLEDFGLWNIASGLEEETTYREYAEAAAVWLIIAGSDIYSDPAWGKRDGNPSPGIPIRDGTIWSTRLAAGETQEMRWNFWKERLLRIGSDESLYVSTREAARQAERAMCSIESVS